MECHLSLHRAAAQAPAAPPRRLEQGVGIVYSLDTGQLRWELTRAAPPPGALLTAAVELDANGAWLVRCDTVAFPPGGIAYLHTHQGPGIRCLLSGALQVEVAGRTHAIAPGGAWFESGPEPVLARAAQEPTSFVRVMILPAALRGKSSIRYVRAEDADKPKTQKYQVFVDQPFDLQEMR
jgi:quercetin dioxygenase-like cupin family protein